MQVKLDPETEARVRELVDSGAYPDQEAVVAAGVRALTLEEDPLFEGIDVEADHQKAIRDHRAGLTREVTPEYLAELRAKIAELPRPKTG